MRSTGLEPVPIAGHAPQTCAYADSATAACNDEIICVSSLFVKFPADIAEIIRWLFDGQDISEAGHIKHFAHDIVDMGHLHATLGTHDFVSRQQNPEAG